MRRAESWQVILVLLGTAALTFAQGRASQRMAKPKETKSLDLRFSNQPPDPFKENIISLEKRLWEASKNFDKATYASLLATDYYEVSDLGISTRAEALESLEGPVADYNLDDFKVTKLADNAALVTYKSSVRAGSSTVNALDTELWVNRDGKWQTTFFQETSLSRSTARQRRKR
ncbi:MAG TPA: nuclear transport factor 2 family protein [Terriglobia bacterium]|nr:nuclear transport factor 2 family protein [Terriglobia bacterium]